MSHTPGPWECEPSFYKDEPQPDGYNIVAGGVTVVGTEGIYSDHEADARLIAAAPDLLAALREAREYVIDYGSEKSTAPVVERIDAAIAKAEGRA